MMRIRCAAFWTMLGACVLVIVTGQSIGDPTAGSDESTRWSTVYSQKRKAWLQPPPQDGWGKNGSPELPFDLGSMFQQSEMVIEARLKPCVYQGHDGKVKTRMLLVTCSEVNAVYKGRVATDVVDWTGPRQLTIHVSVDPRHSGHEGYGLPRFDTPYLLFLYRMPDNEVKARGYAEEDGVIYNIYRGWQGLIALSEEKTGQCANSYLAHRSSAYRRCDLYFGDIRSAVAELSLVAKEGGLGTIEGLRLRSELGHSIIERLDKQAKGSAASDWDAIVAAYGANIPKCYMIGRVYREYLNLDMPSQKDKRDLAEARIRLLARLADDVLNHAGRRDAKSEVKARPTDTSPDDQGTPVNMQKSTPPPPARRP